MQSKRRSLGKGCAFLVIAIFLGSAGMTLAKEPAVVDARAAFRQRLSAALEKKLDWDYAQKPLAEVMAHLSHQTGLTIKLAGKKLDEVGVPSDTPVTFSARQLSLRTGLQLILRELELTWRVGANSLLITTPEDADGHLEVRIYDVGDLLEHRFPCRSLSGGTASPERLGPPDFDSLIDVLTTLIAPSNWDTVGGTGAIHESGRRSLAIAQTWEVHEKIEHLFAAWRRMKADCAQEPTKLRAAYYGAPDVEATWQALTKVASQEIDMPLHEVAAQWSKSLGVFVGLARRKLDEVGVTPETPVRGEIQGVRFFEGALEVLDPQELSLKVLNDAVLITTREHSESELFLRFYPLYDLCPPGDTLRARQRVRERLTELENLMQQTVGPPTWDAVGGPASSRIISNPPALAVCQTPGAHAELERLLTELRASEAAPQASGTKPAAASKEQDSGTERRVYRLTDGPLASERRVMGGNADKSRGLTVDAAEIAKLVRRNVDSASWDERDAALDWFENRLICKNTPRVLEEVEEFLLQLDVWEGHTRGARPFLSGSPPVVGGGAGFFAVPDRER
jgi:hypothetical protein